MDAEVIVVGAGHNGLVAAAWAFGRGAVGVEPGGLCLRLVFVARALQATAQVGGGVGQIVGAAPRLVGALADLTLADAPLDPLARQVAHQHEDHGPDGKG